MSHDHAHHDSPAHRIAKLSRELEEKKKEIMILLSNLNSLLTSANAAVSQIQTEVTALLAAEGAVVIPADAEASLNTLTTNIAAIQTALTTPPPAPAAPAA